MNNNQPDSIALHEFARCSGSLQSIEQQDKYLTPDRMLFCRGVRYLLCQPLDRSSRPKMKDYVNAHFRDKSKSMYNDLYSRLITTLVYMDNKIPLSGVSIACNQIIEGLSYSTTIDTAYNRKDGPCYTVVLYDGYEKMADEHIASHTLVQLAATCDYEKNKGKIRYIEAINPFGQQDNARAGCERYLIKIDSKTEWYAEQSRLAILQLLRRFYLEQKNVPFWTDRCLRCPQEGRCILFREYRTQVSGLIGQI